MVEVVPNSSILTLQLVLKPSGKNSFSDWQAELNQIVASFPGFLSLETILTDEKKHEWVISQRFNSAENLEQWKKSDEYQRLLRKLTSLANINSNPSNIQNGVTEIFVTSVIPENVKAYSIWTAKIHQAEAKFPGFKGTFIQSPEKGSNNWITFLQFDTPDNLDNWINSKERKSLLEEGKSLISKLDNHRMISPFAGWFRGLVINGEAPPAWKQGMLVLLVLFPIVMLEMKYLTPHLLGLNFSLGMFISNVISVGLVTWPMIPLAIWALGWWLLPKGKNKNLITLVGCLLLALIYAIEILALWNIL